MATFAASQQWLHQSMLLIEARPQTTKISCRYSVKPKQVQRVKGAKKTKPKAAATGAAESATPPRAKLVLKTADSVSGACLTYKTTKAAEVSRLVQLLGQLSRQQAGLLTGSAAATTDNVAMEDAPVATATASTPATSTPAAKTATATPTQQASVGGGGSSKNKKKKGKR